MENFSKIDPKGHFRGATCRLSTSATDYFRHVDKFSLTNIVVPLPFENAIWPFHSDSGGDVASYSMVILKSLGKYAPTINYKLFCPIQ